MKLRLVRSLKKSDCKVTDYGSHVQRGLTRFDGLCLRVYGEESHLHRGKLSFYSDRRNLKFIGLPSGHSSWRVAGFTDVLPVGQMKRLSWSSGLASASMVALGYPDNLLVHWFWRALAMVPFCFIVFQLVIGLTRPQANRCPAPHPPSFLLLATSVVSWLTVGLAGPAATMYEQIGYSVAHVVAKAVFESADLGHRREFVSFSVIRSCSSCEDKPCITGDRFVAGFAHQVTADADDEVEAKDQAQDDGHSTNAAIEKFTAKAGSALREKRRRA